MSQRLGTLNRLALLLLTAAVSFAGELTGKWSGSFEELAPDGSVRRTWTAYMDLKLAGQTVTGSAGPSDAEQHPIANGKLEGNKLTFDLVREEGPTMKFDLTFDGESIKGAVSAQDGDRRLAARIDLKRRPAPAASPDDRAADRQAIRAHIDRIFQAFIHKDRAELRATHAENWLGYLEGSREMIRGVEGYMNHSGYFDPKSP